jgi:hypothetical protein
MCTLYAQKDKGFIAGGVRRGMKSSWADDVVEQPADPASAALHLRRAVASASTRRMSYISYMPRTNILGDVKLSDKCESTG